MRDVLEAVLEEIRAGRRAVLATVVRASGSTPRTAGAKLMVASDGSTVGTIGGGAFEAMVTVDAREMLGEADAETCRLRRYSFTEKGENALGMACGGTAEVFLERVGPGERLIIFGAGHVGLAVARLAATVGFHPELVDDRAEACEAAREQRVGLVHRCDDEYREGVPAIDASCCVAVLTRCHRTDLLALRGVVAIPTRYLGLIGSRRKKETIFAQLREARAASEEQLERIRCPIGLPLGGETPEEIAVSIVAELMQLRRS
jgi:xanthine dehydrogenase accessory factor